MKVWKLIIMIGFLPNLANAEYRAYQLLLERTTAQPRDGLTRWVEITHLSPSHFVAYHGGPLTLRARVLRSWICPGDTSGFKPVCGSPFQLDNIPEALLVDQSIPFEAIPNYLEQMLEERNLAGQGEQP